jgi:hypothetical protein
MGEAAVNEWGKVTFDKVAMVVIVACCTAAAFAAVPEETTAAKGRQTGEMTTRREDVGMSWLRWLLVCAS